jgi:hypothetical protein
MVDVVRGGENVYPVEVEARRSMDTDISCETREPRHVGR